MKEGQNFFRNTACPHFPCHDMAGEDFNCLFCYCPLYALGENCGGEFSYTEKGIKDCSACCIPHRPEGRGHISSRLYLVAKLAEK